MNEAPAKIRILVVDDSAVFRGYWSKLLSGAPDLEVVGSAENGEEAIQKTQELRPAVVILDLEMPVMDGLTAIPFLLKEKVKILIASAFTSEGSARAVEALAKGASDCLPKPSALDPSGSLSSIKAELIEKIRALVPIKSVPITPASADIGHSARTFSAVAIGSSTGGPSALEAVLKTIPKGFSAPIFITQHMPAFFLSALAHRLATETRRPCVEPRDGEVVARGHIYLAPGETHLLAEKKGEEVVLSLFSGPAENFCRPAVDPMFRSLAKVYGNQLLGVVLTGMGEDGKNGAEEIRAHGGQVIVQDEGTSVVWGMPGAVAKAGLASKILPLESIGPWIWNLPKNAAKGGVDA
ncbi:MAG: protein-glutamate methylesterase/protein-glutamine glutaminase [Bdellovibrionota bacterium]